MGRPWPEEKPAKGEGKAGVRHGCKHGNQSEPVRESAKEDERATGIVREVRDNKRPAVDSTRGRTSRNPIKESEPKKGGTEDLNRNGRLFWDQNTKLGGELPRCEEAHKTEKEKPDRGGEDDWVRAHRIVKVPSFASRATIPTLVEDSVGRPLAQAAERQASAGARDGVKGKRSDLAARAPLHALVRPRCGRVHWCHRIVVPSLPGCIPS